jgi:hypothetical protein
MTEVKSRRKYARLAIPVVAAVAFAASIVPATAQDKLGGKTILAPKAATLDALSAAGVTVAPAGNASAGDKGIAFPITKGKLNLDSGSGKIDHSGGLTFSDAHGMTLTVEDFVVKVGAKNVIRASVAGGGKVRLADLNLDRAKIKQRGGKVVVSNVKVSLANKAAKALSATFGLPDLAGANLGKATVKAKT